MPPVDNRPDFAPRWPVCVEEGCRGAQHADTRKCHVHGRDYSGLTPGANLDLRGVEINSAQLVEVLGKFRDHERKRFVFGRVLCEYTWFTGRAWFDNAEIRGSAKFDYACFSVGSSARIGWSNCGSTGTRGSPGIAGVASLPRKERKLRPGWPRHTAPCGSPSRTARTRQEPGTSTTARWSADGTRKSPRSPSG